MSISFLTFSASSRCVLMMGDEGLQVFDVTGKRVQPVGIISWEAENFEDDVVSIIRNKCNKKPLVIINDMVEQHYRKERLPKVSVLDKSGLIRRRLGMSFPNYPVRAALPLSKKHNKSENKSGDVYLFAALPDSEAFQKTMRAARKSLASIIGFYLLPVEATEMLEALAKSVEKKGEDKAVWSIFVGQHHGGGLRQIVTRHGELALTRMTPVIDTDVEPELWAEEVVNELKATMSYLSRFGYSKGENLNVFVISNDGAAERLNQAIDIECDLHIMTASQAALSVNSKIGQQSEQRYADALHAGWIGRKSSFKLPMEATQISDLSKPRKVASVAAVLLFLGLVYQLIVTFLLAQDMLVMREDLDVSQQRLASVEQSYQQEVEEKKALGFDFVLVNNSIKIYEELSRSSLEPFYVLRAIGEALGPETRIDAVSAQALNNRERSRYYNAFPDKSEQEDSENDAPLYKVAFTLSFPPSIDPEVGAATVETLRRLLSERLSGHLVVIERQVDGMSYSSNLVGQVGETMQLEQTEEEDFVAEIVIMGAMNG